MTSRELEEIVEIGSSILSRVSPFSKPAIGRIACDAQGSPYWCHFLARELVRHRLEEAGSWDAFVRQTGTVDVAQVDSLLRALPNKPSVRIYEEALHQVTFGDRVTAEVLLEMAELGCVLAPTTTISRQS